MSKNQKKLSRQTFQSTPSVGRATFQTARSAMTIAISIHALRGEGDGKWQDSPVYAVDISIHALRGEGDVIRLNVYPLYVYFNPRPPWGGRQNFDGYEEISEDISIHALRGEGDQDFQRL